MTRNALVELLVLAMENTELRLQLAEAQDQLVEMAVDAGELHVEIQLLQKQLADAKHDRDVWWGKAEHFRRRSAA